MSEESGLLTASAEESGVNDGDGAVSSSYAEADENPEDWGPCAACCAEGKPCRPCGICCKKLCFAFGCHCCCTELGEKKYMTNVNKEERTCTDLPCCVIMLLCLVIQFVVFIDAATGGAEPRRLTHLADYNGSVCHEHHDEGEFAAWPDIRMYEIRICIDKCNHTGSDERMVTPPWDTDTNDVDEAEAQDVYGYRSKKFLHSMCIPDPKDDEWVSSDLKDNYHHWSNKADNLREAIDRSIGDLYKAWPILIGCCLGAVVLSFAYVKFLQKFADILVWVSIVLIFAGLIVMGTFLINNSAHAYEFGYQKLGDIMKYGGYLLIFLDVMYVFAVCFMVKRIRLATAVAKEATRAMRDAWQLLYFPFVPFLSVFLYGIYWIFVLVNLASVTRETHRKWPNGVNSAYFTNGKTLNQSLSIGSRTHYKLHEIKDTYKYAVLFNIFMFMWVLAFITYASYMTITGVYAEWYFSEWEDDETEAHKRVGLAPTEFSPTAVADWARRVVRYHFGTIAVASFSVAMVDFVDFMLTYFEKKLVGSDPTPAQKAMLAVIHCCLKCLRCIMDRINQNGLTITAIYGWPFCASSMKGMKLVFANVVRATAMDMVSGYLIGIGQMTIIALNAAITVWICRAVYENNLSSVLPIVIVACVISYAVARPFLNLFEVAVNTIFICFLIDEERNRGGRMRASARLTRIINEDVKPSKRQVQEMEDTKRSKGLADNAEDEDDADADTSSAV